MRRRILEKFVGSTAVAAGILLVVLVVSGGGDVAPAPPGLIATSIDPAAPIASTPDLVALGKKTFEKQCVGCHGLSGDGRGDAAYLLYPKPRNFTSGKFRVISTWDGVPTDEDLFRTLSRGMPGSAMPSWGHLPERTRWGLVHYVKTFLPSPIQIATDHQPANESDVPSGHLVVPPEPPDTPASRARGRQLFVVSCAPCHGPEGRGDGPQAQFDADGLPIRPRNLTTGVFKSSPEPKQLFCRIMAGLPGSPMPSQFFYYGDDGWALVHFVRSLSSDEQRSRAEMRRFRIVAKRVQELPDHPDASVWRTTPAVDLHLMPLWWREDRPEMVAVQALHDGKEVAIQLVWSDPTHDATAMRPQDFRDAAAIEFSLDPDPPFFAMGEAAHTVNIWMWKSERQADLEPAFQDLEKVYPNLGIDSYPNTLRSALEQPTRHALTLESDPTYVTAWGAHNIVADPTRKSASEDLYAHGFGTLKARPSMDQQVDATGAYETGSYRVVFRRALSGKGQNAVQLKPGETVPVAFAVWNGSAGDRDGKKSVTIWQELVIER
jgi:mono/diheme cytochrome c family protein